MVLKAIIEMPAWTQYKYELNKDYQLVLDRVINQKVPVNYGYVPHTLEPDGDPLDIFVISSQPIIAGSLVKVTPECVFICEDQGLSDNKVVGFLDGETVVGPIARVSIYAQIEEYLKTYKEGFVIKDLVPFNEYFGNVQWPK